MTSRNSALELNTSAPRDHSTADKSIRAIQAANTGRRFCCYWAVNLTLSSILRSRDPCALTQARLRVVQGCSGPTQVFSGVLIYT